jgi:hypothetical protein
MFFAGIVSRYSFLHELEQEKVVYESNHCNDDKDDDTIF